MRVSFVKPVNELEMVDKFLELLLWSGSSS